MADASAPNDRLLEIRDAIDATDQELVRLLNQRAALSLEVGRIKAGHRDIIFKPFREKEVLEKLDKASEGTLPSPHLRAIYREILSSSRSLQRPQRVGYLGPEGTFSYFAGVEFFGQMVDYEPLPEIRDVYQAVANSDVELGVVPLENSLQGTVGQSLDSFFRFDVFIQSELFARISHCLVSTAKDLTDVETVYSHPQPLAQTSGWVREHLPGVKVIPTESTAAAARRVRNKPRAAAIGHVGLASMLGLTVLAKGIEDQPDNWTRFVVIGPTPADQEAKDKTSMLFTLPDKPGALATILEIFAREGINMKKLESRPLRGEKWQYVFFVDVESDLSQEQYQRVLDELTTHCHSLRVLGSYPAGPYLDASRER